MSIAATCDLLELFITGVPIQDRKWIPQIRGPRQLGMNHLGRVPDDERDTAGDVVSDPGQHQICTYAFYDWLFPVTTGWNGPVALHEEMPMPPEGPESIRVK